MYVVGGMEIDRLVESAEHGPKSGDDCRTFGRIHALRLLRL